jgi:hypothetical protein
MLMQHQLIGGAPLSLALGVRGPLVVAGARCYQLPLGLSTVAPLTHSGSNGGALVPYLFRTTTEFHRARLAARNIRRPFTGLRTGVVLQLLAPGYHSDSTPLRSRCQEKSFLHSCNLYFKFIHRRRSTYLEIVTLLIGVDTRPGPS